MIISMVKTIEMLEFMKLYDKTIHKIQGRADVQRTTARIFSKLCPESVLIPS